MWLRTHHDHEHHHHHHADEVFTSWDERRSKLQQRRYQQILKTLEEDGHMELFLRAKGMVAGATRVDYFDMVPQEHEVRSGAAEYTGRICVIGSRLEEDKLEELFGLKK